MFPLIYATEFNIRIFSDFFFIIINKYGRIKDGRVQSKSMRWNDENDFDKFLFVVKCYSALPQCINIIENFCLVPGHIPNANIQCESTLDTFMCVCLNFMAWTMNTINLFRSTEQRNRLKMIFLYAKHMYNAFKAHKLYGFSISFFFLFCV